MFPGLTLGVRGDSTAEEQRHDACGGWHPEGKQPADELCFDARETLCKLGLEFCLELGKPLLELRVEASEVQLVQLSEIGPVGSVHRALKHSLRSLNYSASSLGSSARPAGSSPG